MDGWMQIMATIICSVFASSGFWAYIQKRQSKNDSKTELLIGLAHDRIMSLGAEYIERGWLTCDEYDNINNYLFTPYEKNGGNGSAKRIMRDVRKLPVHNSLAYVREKTVTGGDPK